MRHLLATATLIATSILLPMDVAFAVNTNLQEALEKHPDLSNFFQAMVTSGVMDELETSKSYTVFAPNNAAFASIQSSKYPCFYSDMCKGQLAAVIRSHILPGEQYVDVLAAPPGIAESISGRQVTLAKPADFYTVEGKRVLGEDKLGGDVLYTIDGLIASDFEMAIFQKKQSVTQTVTQPACQGDMCPPAVKTTTVITAPAAR